jgi:hypothetical protein
VCGGQNDISDKNDVISVYTESANMLDNHFKLLKNDDMNNILSQVGEFKSESKVNKFLDGVINEFSGSDKNDYVRKRHNVAQLLFNKLSIYINNSIERKTSLLKQREFIFNEMQKNDDEVKSQIEKLKMERKENSELVYSLHKDNQILIHNMKSCEKLNNIKSVCEENGNLYKTILKSYERITESLQKIYKLVKN